MQPHVAPPAPTTQEGRAARLTQTVIAFGCLLTTNAELRQRCKDKEAFKREVLAWKAAEMSYGRHRVGSPADILFQLKNMSAATRSKNACARIKKVSGSRVTFGQTSMATPVSTSTSERNGKQGIVGHLAANEPSFSQDDFVPPGPSTRREIIVKNTAEQTMKQGIIVHPAANEPIFSKDNAVPPGQSMQREITVKNTTNAICTLERRHFSNANGSFSLQVKRPASASLPLTIEPHRDIILQVQYTPTFHGFSRTTLQLQFRLDHYVFFIGRCLEARCGDAHELQDLAPTAEYKRKRPKPRPAGSRVVTEPPPLPPHPSAKKKPKMLPSFVPRTFKQAVRSNTAEKALQAGAALMQSADAGTAIAGYAQHLQHLLWAEEMQLHLDLRAFDLDGPKATTLAKSRLPGCLQLRVNGLAEKRPSVLHQSQS
eukprot:6211779-Pleurochrysis_carterae.AAC.5